MSITFSPSERLAITRRQVRIMMENAGFATSINSFNQQQAQLLQVDGGNAKFYNFYNDICTAYENESRAINGNIADTYLPSDIVSAAQTPSVPPFFPSSPSSAYTRNIPLIQDGSFTNNKVKGYFHPTGTDPRFELNILTNTVVLDGLTQMIFRLENGISFGTATATTLTSIPAGNISGHFLSTSSTFGFSVGDLVYIHNSAASGIYVITSIIPLTGFSVSSVIPTQIGMSGTSTIKNGVPAFTATERQTLTSANYQELLLNITNRISFLISEWESKIDAQIAALTLNQDSRSPQNSQNATALTNVNNTKNIIDTWQALPNTGVTGKYTAASIANISANITARQTYLPNRITEITAALGNSSSACLVQSGENYSTTVPNNPYFNRYKWLNFRINRSSGSLRRYYAADQSKGAVQGLLNDNNAIKSEYDAYFLTKPIIFNDGSDILHIKDTAGLFVGDTITVVSETQPEITRSIVSFMGTTQIKLNAAVPKTYKVEDVARIFKTL